MSQTIKDGIKTAIKYKTETIQGGGSGGNQQLMTALKSNDGLTALEAQKLLGIKSDTSTRTQVRNALRKSAPEFVPIMQEIGQNQVRYFSVKQDNFAEFKKQMKTNHISYRIDKKCIALYPELSNLL